ncbi:hypothetical protein HPP92_006700 [Vanilla planifolia]|uniref:Uncharacterized protein n=1 Tax=Vanilla planifolia TaxID=51239 RepID=A0A835RPQ8_VANPL|nr:hypothetical protein HPP92_006700 [Vanilla planifolia]
MTTINGSRLACSLSLSKHRHIQDKADRQFTYKTEIHSTKANKQQELTEAAAGSGKKEREARRRIAASGGVLHQTVDWHSRLACTGGALTGVRGLIADPAR